MDFADAVAAIEAALGRGLPGATAHGLMAPRPRRQWPDGFNLAGIRHAAALLLLVREDDGSAAVVLTVRANALGRHSGQVSMPGGVIEPGEATADASLREAHEEIGLDVTGVRVLGALTALDIPVSGFRLHPIVASLDHRPRFEPAPDEVARVLEVPLEWLLDPTQVAWRSSGLDERRFEFPCFPFDGAEIWGATAMALAEFLALLEWRGPRYT